MLRPYIKEFMLDEDEFDQYMADAAEVTSGYNDNVGSSPPEGLRFSFPISEYVIEDAGIQRTLDEISSIKPTRKSGVWKKLITRFLE
jgi:hypothetical protein